MPAAPKKLLTTFTAENMKIFIAVIVLFTVSIPFLVIGPSVLNKIDGAMVQASSSAPPAVALGLPERAGVEKKPNLAILTGQTPSPQFSAWATIAVDLASNQILYENNIHIRHAPASTTKLMTALVAEEIFSHTTDMLTVPQNAIVDGSVMGLQPSQRLTYRSLLYGMLLSSGNDAAYTLAIDSPGGFNGFVEKMNSKALDMGLADTHFTNPAGFDNPNHYSSAYDLSQIAKAAAIDPQLARVVATKDTSVTLWQTPRATTEATISAKNPRIITLHNLNQLLNIPGVIGMKTGTTENAGENLVGLVDRDGHKIITVMLGSKNRFIETKQLIDWIHNNYTWY